MEKVLELHFKYRYGNAVHKFILFDGVNETVWHRKCTNAHRKIKKRNKHAPHTHKVDAKANRQ